MAKMLLHPGAGKNFKTEEFRLPDGIVTLRVEEGDLTIQRALFLLEMTKAHIIHLAHEQ